MIRPRDLLAITADIARGLRAIAHDVDNRVRPPRLPEHLIAPDANTWDEYRERAERGQG